MLCSFIKRASFREYSPAKIEKSEQKVAEGASYDGTYSKWQYLDNTLF